jgi:hypothetical protein
MCNASSSRRIFITLCISLLTPWGAIPRAEGASTTLVRPPFRHNLGFNTLRQFHLTAYGGEDFVLDDPRGIAATKLRSRDAEGPGDDDEVTVIGVNAGRGELIYNPTLISLARFGARDMPAPGFDDPVGVAVDRDGWVAVGDRGNDRVVLLRFDADVALHWAREVRLDLKRPAGVALARSRVFIADSGNDRIVVTDTTGALLQEVTGIDEPFDVDVIAGPPESAFSARSFMVVTHGGGAGLTRSSLTGDERTRVTYGEVTGTTGRGFDYVAIDYYGNVFVTDPGSGCIFKFTSDLRLLDRFECGASSGELGQPRGIGLHRRLGQVFVAEAAGVSYYWVGTDVTCLSARVTERGDPLGLEVRFVLTERSDVTVSLEDAQGSTAVVLARRVRMSPGPRRLTYRVDAPDLPCDIATCTYRLVVTARATYASRAHHQARRWTPLGAVRQRSQ